MFHNLVEQFGIWVQQYGYGAIFLVVMLGLLPLPLPEETFLTLVGVFAAQGRIHPVPAALAAYAGTTTGITIMYILGRTAGWAFTRRFGRYFGVTPERLQRAHDWFDRRGKWTLTLGYWIPYFRHVNAFAAGTSKVRYGEFALFAYPGGAAWVAMFVTLGYILGENWKSVTPHARGILMAMAVLIIAAIFVYGYNKKRQAAKAGKGPL